MEARSRCLPTARSTPRESGSSPRPSCWRSRLALPAAEPASSPPARSDAPAASRWKPCQPENCTPPPRRLASLTPGTPTTSESRQTSPPRCKWTATPTSRLPSCASWRSPCQRIVTCSPLMARRWPPMASRSRAGRRTPRSDAGISRLEACVGRSGHSRPDRSEG